MNAPTDTERLDFYESNNDLFRFVGHPTMDGKYPCWQVWTRTEGATTRKTLREAIDACMEGAETR